MTGSCDTSGCDMIVLVKLCLPALIPRVATSMPRYLSQILDGRVCFPWLRRGDSCEALSLLFQQDGVPPKMIIDGSKEHTLGYFTRKVSEAGCHLKQTEPKSPWQMDAEGGIRELKRGLGRKITKMKSPKLIWDDCLELEAYIRSNTALVISSWMG